MSALATNSTALAASGREFETRVPEILVATIVGPVLAIIFVAMRIYTRVVLVRKHFLEDYSIVAALVGIDVAAWPRLSNPSNRSSWHADTVQACTIAMSVFMGLSRSSNPHPTAIS